ncbi:MAG: 3-deoxy-manno-octulosonate cytidylyltransferase [Nitrospinota bacterium]|nr:MAG: 3-deoxy-manno-octulosonate cytidylyltransferase [Nitrospinota bacterium]
MKAVAIIPARYASTRFPGKPLADICGRPMIQHVYSRVQQATLVSRTLVATDDTRIFQAVKAFGGEVVMTSPRHPSGTDRLAEVAASLSDELIVNVQGDEPLIHPTMIDEAIQLLLEEEHLQMGTLKNRLDSPEEVFNPAITKVVTDLHDYALYFSKGPIPYCRDEWGDLIRQTGFPTYLPPNVYRHIGLYVYRRDFLLHFTQLPPTPLEQVEKLEQLRALEHGYRIKVGTTRYTSIGVDTPEDLERVKRLMQQSSSAPPSLRAD